MSSKNLSDVIIMQDLLYNYDTDSTFTENNHDNHRDDYYKKQYKVRLYLWALIGASVLLSLIFTGLRLTTLKKTYICINNYESLLVDQVEPPFIHMNNKTHFYTFIDPSYEVTFQGTFIRKRIGDFILRKYEDPMIELNDTRFIPHYSVSNCSHEGFFRHYDICTELKIKFELNTNEHLDIQVYPIKITIHDPHPDYSLYNNDILDTGCSASIDFLIIPFNNQNCFVSNVEPLTFCDNRTEIQQHVNPYKNLTFDMSGKTAENEWKYFNPFVHQKLFIGNEVIERTMKPTLIQSISETEIKIYEEFYVNQIKYDGKMKSFDIQCSQNGKVAQIDFYKTLKLDVHMLVTNHLNFVTIPLLDDFSTTSFFNLYIIGGFYINDFHSTKFTVNRYSTETQHALIDITSAFTFFSYKLPQIYINDVQTQIIKYDKAQTAPFGQYFKTDQTLISCEQVTVETHLSITSDADIKSIKIVLPDCDNCQYTEEYTN